MNSCLLCNKHQGNNELYILTTNNFILYHGPIESNILGYIYIESIRHIEYWSHLNAEEQQELGQLISQIEGILINTLNIERLYAVSIAEAVRHFHIHLIPRNASTDKGLPLIKQATQQTVPPDTPSINSSDVYNLISTLKNRMNSI